MAITYTKRNNNMEVHVHVNANGTVIVAGNNTVSNLTSNTSEVVSNARISSAEWGLGGSATGHIVVTRGNSTVNAISHVFVNSGKIENMPYEAANSVLTAGDINVTFVGSANGYVVLGLKKNT